MTVELFATAREVARASSVALDLDEPATLRDVLRALASEHPNLLGTVLDATTFAPLEPNLVLLDGRRAVALDDVVTGEDRPCLLALPSGG